MLYYNFGYITSRETSKERKIHMKEKDQSRKEIKSKNAKVGRVITMCRGREQTEKTQTKNIIRRSKKFEVSIIGVFSCIP